MYIVKTLTAYQFNRQMSSGRTKPCLITCEDDQANISEQVVKLRNSVNFNQAGLASELTAALIAKKLGLDIPEPSLVKISQEFADSVTSNAPGRAIRESVGLNYGSAIITGGYPTWPAGKPLTAALEEKACEIIAFDALIQNPDRRVDNPNVLSKSQEIYIIDHEMAFSFLHALGVMPAPYLPEAFSSFLKGHLFYRQLKSKDLKLDRFVAALKAFTEQDIEHIFNKIPAEWNNEATAKMKTHVLTVLKHQDKFIDSVRRVVV